MTQLYYVRQSRYPQKRWGVRTTELPLSKEIIDGYPRVGAFSLVDQSIVELVLRHTEDSPAERQRMLDEARTAGLSYEEFCAKVLRESVAA